MHNSLALSTPGPRKANLSLTQAAVTLLQGTQLHTNGCMCAGKTGLCLCPRAESYQGLWEQPCVVLSSHLESRDECGHLGFRSFR